MSGIAFDFLLALALYACAYFADQPQGVDYFWPLTGYLLAAMNAPGAVKNAFQGAVLQVLAHSTAKAAMFAAAGAMILSTGRDDIARLACCCCSRRWSAPSRWSPPRR